MTSKTLLCLISLVSVLTLSGQNALKPSMDASGKITFGSKSIWIKKGLSQINLIIDNNINILGSCIFDFGHGELSPCFFLNKKMHKDARSITWESDMVAGRGKKEILGHFITSLTLQKNNLVKVYCKYTLKPGVSLKKSYFFLAWSGGVKLEGYYQTGSKKIELASRKHHFFGKQPDLSLNFFPDYPAKKMRIIPVIYSKGVINTAASRIGFYPENNELEFLVDLSGEKRIIRSSEYYSGTDFWKIDRLCLPQYKLCRNLIPNPSFEAGLRYWNFKNFGSFSPKLIKTYILLTTQTQNSAISLLK